MPLRNFGRTGIQVSELAFGAWGIGGAYGRTGRADSIDALAKAEELGCNFVDTAAVYGDSEEILGEFLGDRRSRWVISTKFSGQSAGLQSTLESQLSKLRTSYVDLYLLHWMPRGKEASLLTELQALKKAGKCRAIGVSLYTAQDVDDVLAMPEIDGFMVALSLLDPDPFVARRTAIAQGGKGVLARSSLREGFLAGKFKKETRFTDPADQRSKWTAEQIEKTVAQVEQFRFLESQSRPLAQAAIAYPLSFPEISSVVVGSKRASQSAQNFGDTAGKRLGAAEMARIAELQRSMGLRVDDSFLGRLKRKFGRS